MTRKQAEGLSCVRAAGSRRWKLWVRRVLAVVQLAPPMALAFYALSEPWARARVVLILGISRSPGAMLLVMLSLLATLAAAVAVAGRRRTALLSPIVHLGTGALMCIVSFMAYRMIEASAVRAFGFIPLGSVGPGPGLKHFFIAALMVVGLGLVELTLVLLQRHRRSRRSGQAAESDISSSVILPRLGAVPAPPHDGAAVTAGVGASDTLP